MPAIEGGYRNKLYTLLNGAGVNLDFVGTFYDLNNLGLPDVDYQGQSGAKINDIRGNLPGWLNAIEDPDIILLLIGTNDIWGNQAAGIQDRLISLVNEIAILRPHARIILSNLPRLTDNPFYLAQGEAHNDTLPEVVADLADQGIPVSLIDMHAVLTPTDFSSDAVHPSVGGYEKMADTWFPAIIEVLDQPPVIERVTPADDLTHLTVDFSKPVADDSVNLANFSISGGLAISNAAARQHHQAQHHAHHRPANTGACLRTCPLAAWETADPSRKQSPRNPWSFSIRAPSPMAASRMISRRGRTSGNVVVKTSTWNRPPSPPMARRHTVFN